MNGLIRYAGIMFSFFITANFYIIMFFAMSNGRSVTVYFDMFGEATIEYLMYIIVAPFIIYAFIYELKRRKKHGKKRVTKTHN